ILNHLKKMYQRLMILVTQKIFENKKAGSFITFVECENNATIFVDYKKEILKKMNLFLEPMIVLSYEKIPFFVDECSKENPDEYHRLDENILNHLKKVYQHLTDKYTPKEIKEINMSQEEINLYYAAAYRVLSKALHNAAQIGKCLLIADGE